MSNDEVLFVLNHASQSVSPVALELIPILFVVFVFGVIIGFVIGDRVNDGE